MKGRADVFDYIIVGAGSAGSVLADRLSESGRDRVLVLEAGPKDRSPWIHLPAGYGKLFHHDRLVWKHKTEPQESLGGRADYWPRGRVVGGSGAINAMVYVRGLARDFDDWESAGAKGWGWKDVRRAFEKIETHVAPDGSKTGTGKIHVSDVRDQVHKVNARFFEAADELDLPKTDDHNRGDPEGATIYRINTRRGQRCSSARAFLRPALKRANLHLRTGALVRRVVFDGKKATGVEIEQNGKVEVVHAREIILSAGAVQSPKILQLSGIGPGGRLSDLGIPVLVANDNVGGNLQDHLAVSYYFRATEPTLNNLLAPWYGKAFAAMKYALSRRGPLALSVNQCGGFFCSDPARTTPDQQIYFNPVTYTTKEVGAHKVIDPDPFPGFIIAAQPTRPTSRGRIDARSADPADAPIIQPNALGSREDCEAAVRGARFCARLMAAPALKALTEAPMGIDLLQMTDDDLLKDFRARCGTVFHPVSTCRMGPNAEAAVIDSELRVFGVEGLRVVDASSFPNITSGNTNAPTMMLAYRASELILQATRKRSSSGTGERCGPIDRTHPTQ